MRRSPGEHHCFDVGGFRTTSLRCEDTIDRGANVNARSNFVPSARRALKIFAGRGAPRQAAKKTPAGR